MASSTARQDVGNVLPFRKANIITLADVIPEPVHWLWEGRIPYGKLTIIDGDPGTGKSHLTLEIAARVSRGQPLPGGHGREPHAVILLAEEDGLGDTIQPRLVAAGGDVTRVHALRDVSQRNGDDTLPSFPEDVDLLAAAIHSHHARLVIIDPLMSYLSDGINPWSDKDVRKALMPLSRLAQETRCAIVLIRHLNKKTDTPAMYRGGGSIGIIGVVRSGLLVAVDPDNPEQRVLAGTKANLGPLAPSLLFKLETGPTGSSRIEWGGECDITAQELLSVTTAPQGEDNGVMAKVLVWLSSVLREGPQQVQDVVARKEANGIPGSKRTLERAKTMLGVLSKRQTFQGPVFWSLPDSIVATPAESATVGDIGVDGEYAMEESGQTGRTECLTRQDSETRHAQAVEAPLATLRVQQAAP